MQRIVFLRPIVAVLFFVTGLLAQHLPEGAYHTNRERDYDLIHYRAELTLNMEQRSVSGVATVTAVPLHALEEFSLDAYRLQIRKVWLNRGSSRESLPYRQGEEALQIFLPESYQPGDTFTVSVEYRARPNAGMYFQPDPGQKGRFFVYTYGEGGLHANWLPIYNDVNDKFSSEMIVTVPAPYTVVSNGTLVKSESLSRGTRRFHWKQELPHSDYLIALYVGAFDQGELPPAKHGTPLHFWVPKGRLAEGQYAFRNTPRMVDFFSQRFNYPYPWDKYDQIAIPDYAIGAMEHTSVTGHRASVLRREDAPDDFGPDLTHYYNVWTADGTIAHELAHHWFGDNLTCRNLSYIWLNESFATYLQMLWDEFALGREQLYLDRQTALDRYLEYVHTEHIIRPLEYHYFDGIDPMYNTEHTYFKGALVLHMLRNILGDEDFFRAMSYYLHKHEFENVDSHDLKIALEEATGRNLEWFFEDWIYGGGHPVLEVQADYLPQHRLLRLNLHQVQPIIEGQDLFTLPVDVTLVVDGKPHHHTVWIEDREEQFLLDCSGEPEMISIDGEGRLIAEIRFPRSVDQLAYQVAHDALPGRVWALRQMADRFPAHPRTVEMFSDLLTGEAPWWLKAEAARRLDRLTASEAERLVKTALQAADYHVRKAAVLALPRFRPAFAESTLVELIEHDPHTDVVAAAIVALSRVNGANHEEVIRRQLNRPAWYNEITLACLMAFENLGDPGLVSVIEPYCGYPYNQHVRNAALNAWAACAPGDGRLHSLLLDLAQTGGYSVRRQAISLLGSLGVTEARAVLEEIARTDGDIDVRLAAESALESLEDLQNAKAP
ncbi:MAG: hypothetical protein D6681_00470 [Calditrichaeota bacterium]|nr:MAG: hypothetical protein D6681_00470 [Calditrichota bacterium]